MSSVEVNEEKEKELAKARASKTIFEGFTRGIGRTTLIRTDTGKEYLVVGDKIVGSWQKVLPEVQAEARQQERATITREYRLPVESLGSKQTPALQFTLSDFSEVRKAILTIVIGATQQDIPLLGWKLDSVVVNGQVFVANHPINSVITIHDTNMALVSLRTDQPNTLIIRHFAPLGAGVITPDVPVDVRLHVTGIEANPVERVPRTFTDLSALLQNNLEGLKTAMKESTPLAVTVLVIIAIIIVALAWIISHPSVRAVSSVAESASNTVNSAVSEIAK